MQLGGSLRKIPSLTLSFGLIRYERTIKYQTLGLEAGRCRGKIISEVGLHLESSFGQEGEPG